MKRTLISQVLVTLITLKCDCGHTIHSGNLPILRQFIAPLGKLFTVVVTAVTNPRDCVYGVSQPTLAI